MFRGGGRARGDGEWARVRGMKQNGDGVDLGSGVKSAAREGKERNGSLGESQKTLFRFKEKAGRKSEHQSSNSWESGPLGLKKAALWA